MTDMGHWSREAISGLIDLYKTHPCLWKRSSQVYNNRRAKVLAYKELIQFCKSNGFPEANKDFVTKKIGNLRRCFRKELQKTLKHQSRGENYKAPLWYFNRLMFVIRDEEKDLMPSVTNDSASDDDMCETEYLEEEIKFEADSGTMGDSLNYDTPTLSYMPSKRKSDYDLEFCDIEDIPSKDSYPSEFNIIGMNIANKLAKMDEQQAMYAEFIINSVVKRGLLKKLTEDTDVCDNQCRKGL